MTLFAMIGSLFAQTWPLLLLAAAWILGGWFMDRAEERAGMDETRIEGEIQRRVAERIAPVVGVQEHAERIHAQMQRDGLFRDKGAHERLGDAEVAV